MAFNRRQFLSRFAALSGCFAATASPLAFALSHSSSNSSANAPGNSSGNSPAPPDQAFRFPQGVASADPQPDAVLLWTRLVPKPDLAATSAAAPSQSVAFKLQVAPDRTFTAAVLELEAETSAASDFTVRCFIDGLEPDQHYYYRFIAADGSISPLGRTRTAPAPDAMRPLNIAVFSCQLYDDGFFSAYRRLLIDDAAAPADNKIDFIVHTGDYIYEYFDAVMPGPEEGQRLELRDRKGKRRSVRPVPSPGAAERKAAESLDEYRHLYRTYISDPDLMAARAHFPFVHIWDDHEIVNDYWQSYAKGEPMQRRKVDANQAWFEYIPAILSQAGSGPVGLNPAHDFARAEVENRPLGPLDEHYLSHEANNLAAIGGLSIYRSLQWGRLADLFALDSRSYRGERGVDEGLLKGSIAAYPTSPVDAATVKALNAGRTANNGAPPETVRYQGKDVPNPRRNAPVGSLLGQEQKAWLKQSLTNSKANWKLILNGVPFLRFGFDMSFRPGEPENGLLWTDSWDGYPLERSELMHFIRDKQLANVVSLTGDRHAHFAGLVYDDYDNRTAGVTATPIIPEFVCASVSAVDRATAHARVLGHEADLDALLTFDGRPFGYDSDHVPSLNAWLLFGADAARVLSETGDANAARQKARPTVNPHLRYADTDAYGYFIAQVRESETHIEFVTIPTPHQDYGENGPPVIRRVRYQLARWEAGQTPQISPPEIDGPEPLLGIKQGRNQP